MFSSSGSRRGARGVCPLIWGKYIFYIFSKEVDPKAVVVDSTDLLANPSGVLSRYCEAVVLPFSDSLLHVMEHERERYGILEMCRRLGGTRSLA